MSYEKISIPDYEIIERLGESPQSVVYKAFHRKDLRKLLAIMVLNAKALRISYSVEYQKLHFRQKIKRQRFETAMAGPLPLGCYDKKVKYKTKY
ncbi:MAG: hypothetical protein AB1498_06035 [bacterium]